MLEYKQPDATAPAMSRITASAGKICSLLKHPQQYGLRAEEDIEFNRDAIMLRFFNNIWIYYIIIFDLNQLF
jgi:hypothetical protein